MLKNLAPVALSFACLGALPEQAVAQSSGDKSWLSSTWDTAWDHAKTTWREGDYELYVPLYTYHMPWAYTQEQLNSYTEYPGGIGLGKGRYNASGNWEGMYAMGFRDSHGDPSFMVGYGWIPTWNVGKSEVRVGVGLTGFLMSRNDYFGGIPFPGILPVASLSYSNLALQAAYVPGGKNNGNVFFIWGKWTFK